MMEKSQPATHLPEKSASLVGFSMLLLVLLQQLSAFVLNFIAPVQNVGVSPKNAFGVGFAGQAIDLVLILLCTALPLAFLQKTAKGLGYSLHKGKNRVSIIILLPLFMGAAALVNSLNNFFYRLMSGVFGFSLQDTQGLPLGAAAISVYFLRYCVVSPILEELLFRGTVQQLLRCWGPRFAMLLTCTMFALLHGNFWQLPTVLILGFMLCYIYEVSHSVRACIVLHFANNFFGFIMQLAREKMHPTAALAFILWLMLLFVALFVASVWALRKFKIWHKLRLVKDAANFGSFSKRIFLIAKVPLFLLGFLALFAQLIFNII